MPRAGRRLFRFHRRSADATALHEWVKTAEIDSGKRSGVPSDVSDRLKALERENRELRQANEILRKASAHFAQAELTAVQAMIAFIDDHREVHGVEPICKVLPIAPSTYHAHVAKRTDPKKLSTRAKQDMALTPEIARVFAENFEVYGVRKVWRQLQRELDVARCTVERLMRGMGSRVIRGKPVRTTISTRRRRAHWTTSIASSTRRARMRCGSRISPTSRPGPALSMSPSS